MFHGTSVGERRFASGISLDSPSAPDTIPIGFALKLSDGGLPNG